MRVIFAGTPEFARSALTALHAAGHDIVGVLTQPDRPAGRGMKLQASAVKQFALSKGLTVVQPHSLKLDGKYPDEAHAAQAFISNAQADVMVVAAYGLILPQAVLDTPKYGCLNIHGSLLPRWRGAAPIQRAIATGDVETGITIMQMAAGLDTGDMMYKTYCPITAEDTSASLHDKLAIQGAEAICTVLESEQSLKAFIEKREVQDEALTVYAHKLVKTEARIDWTQNAVQIDRNIRAFNPWPVAFIQLDENNALRVWGSMHSDHSKADAQVGEIIAMDKYGVHVACGENTSVCLTSLQWPGAKALNPVQIAQTQKLHLGQILP